MNWFGFLGNLIGILMYPPLCREILRGNVKQNFATWILWATLDGIVAASIAFQHGSFWLPVIYTVGSGVTALCIWRCCERTWKWFETTVTLLAVICMIIWVHSGPYVATIASTTAIGIATIPLLVDCYQKPHEVPMSSYVGFFLANAFTVLGGKEWAVRDRFYPSGAALLCLLILGLGAQKYFRRSSFAAS